MKTGIHKYLLIIFILSVYIKPEEVFAQTSSTADIVTAPNAIFVEFFGQAYILSANYDRIL